MVQLTYYPPLGEAPAQTWEPAEWEPSEGDVHLLKWGYLLTDVDRLTRRALARNRGSALPYLDRYEIAWEGIVEHLYAAQSAPTPADLVEAGWLAMDLHLKSEMRHHGRVFAHGGGIRDMPRFAVHWEWTVRPTGSPEPQIVERLALRQIWPLLTEGQRRYLKALAVHGDYVKAAEALGITVKTLHAGLHQARQAFLRLWHEGEDPSRAWGTDRRVGSRSRPEGKTKKSSVARVLKRRQGGRPVKELVHGRSSTYKNHRCRCLPCTTAASAQAAERRRKSGIKTVRRLTVSQVAEVRERHEAGETLRSIAKDLGFANSYLSRLLSGKATPAPDLGDAA